MANKYQKQINERIEEEVHTDANGYRSRTGWLADPLLFDKTCERCGKKAAWGAGRPPKHFLCLKCADDWSEYDMKSLDSPAWMKRWEPCFKRFIDEYKKAR